MSVIICRITQGLRAAEGPASTTPPSAEEEHHPDRLTAVPASHTVLFSWGQGCDSTLLNHVPFCFSVHKPLVPSLSHLFLIAALWFS